MQPTATTIDLTDLQLDYDTATDLAHRAARAMNAPPTRVVIDLSRARSATTAGLARLILLRQALHQSGRDLAVTGMTPLVASLWSICRLQRALPHA